MTTPKDTAPFNAGLLRVLRFRGNHLTEVTGKLAESVASFEHRKAVSDPPPKPFALALKQMLTGWANYAVVHQLRYKEPIGHDTALGPEWIAIGKALKGSLDGDTGGLDCGSIDQNILECMTENGVDLEKEGLV